MVDEAPHPTTTRVTLRTRWRLAAYQGAGFVVTFVALAVVLALEAGQNGRMGLALLALTACGVSAGLTRSMRALRDEIAERRRAEAALKASEQRTRALLEERERAAEQHRRLQAQVQQTQKLESLGVLAGGIAHDFNNLLMGILGHADLARTSLPPHAPARESVEGVLAAARRAAELCGQMLAYSGRGPFVVEPVDLNVLVREMGRLLEVSISKSCRLSYDLTDRAPLVEADATQLRQVVMNLITNASEAMGEEGGSIVLATGRERCGRDVLARAVVDDGLPAGEYAWFEVVDTGCGMDAETRERIFDPFFTTKFTGRGLGLAAVLGIVRGHRGAVCIDTHPLGGTSFRVLLPLCAARAPAGGIAAGEDGWRGHGLVLLVDDEPMVRQVATQMLARAGFDVLPASDGVRAVEALRARADAICCVVLDLTMPRMSGRKAFAALREIRADVPVVFSSGYHESDVSVSLPEGEGVGFVQKPYDAATLARAVRAVLGRQPQQA